MQKDDGIINNGVAAPSKMTGCGTPDAENRNWYDWDGGPKDSPTARTGIYHDAM